MAENMIHNTHESAWGFGEAEWHNQPLIETAFGLEGGFPFVSDVHADLVVTALKIYLSENDGARKFIKHII